MADKDTKATLRSALTEFDTMHLHKIRVAAYDRWCWDTGTDSDRDWFEISDEILIERSANPMNNTGPNSVNITASALKLTAPGNNVSETLFEVTNSHLELGYDLKLSLIKFLCDEIQWESYTTGNQGYTLKQSIRQEVQNTICTNRSQIEIWIQEALEKHDKL